MKPRLLPATLLALLGIASTPFAHAAEAADASPYDKNPACLERSETPNANCEIQDEGTPRQRYAPPGSPGARPPGTTPPGTGTPTPPATPAPRDGGKSRPTTR